MQAKSIFLILLILALSQSTNLKYQIKKGKSPSRDFVKWMQTVPQPPPHEQYGTGLKYLIASMNGYVAQQLTDEWVQDLNEAAKFFPKFCNTGNEEKDKMEFAAFLSILGAETSFQYNFPQTHEQNCPDCQRCSYNTKGLECQKNSKLQYYGRGPLQLSWNYNYASFSEYMFGDENVLLENPDMVTDNKEISWASAIWFWNQSHNYGGYCMPQWGWKGHDQCEVDCPDGPSTTCPNSNCSPIHWLTPGHNSCHDAIHTGGGMGEVMNIINGGYDCCMSSSFKNGHGHVLYRTWWYIDVYNKWTKSFQYDNLNEINLQNCPLAKNMNCSKLAEPRRCWSYCCVFNDENQQFE